MLQDLLQMLDPMPAAILAAIAGIFGALAGAVVGGVMGWIGAYNVARITEEHRAQAEAARRQEDAKSKNDRVRSAISVAVETFLLRWRRAMEFTSPSMPIPEKQLQELAADVAGFRGFGRDLVDIQSVHWRDLYLQWYTDIHELHVAFNSLSRKEADETNPMKRMDERLRADAEALLERIRTSGDRLRLAVDVFDAGESGLVPLPGLPRVD